MAKLKLTDLKKFKVVNNEETLTIYGKGVERTVLGSKTHDSSKTHDTSNTYDMSTSHDSSTKFDVF